MDRTEAHETTAEEDHSVAERTPTPRSVRDRLADQWERRLTLPVIIAAAVSIPAVFLTMTPSLVLQVAGHTLNWASLAVLGAELVVLLLLAGDKLAWIRRHKWKLLVTAVAVPAVVFTVAPLQALRLLKLVRLVGTLRILRTNTIVSAGRTMARRFELTGPWRFVPVFGASVLAAGFVAIVLADPTASRQHEELVEEVAAWAGVLPVLAAGLILGTATFIVLRYRRRGPAGEEDEAPEAPEAPEGREGREKAADRANRTN